MLRLGRLALLKAAPPAALTHVAAALGPGGQAAMGGGTLHCVLNRLITASSSPAATAPGSVLVAGACQPPCTPAAAAGGST